MTDTLNFELEPTVWSRNFGDDDGVYFDGEQGDVDVDQEETPAPLFAWRPSVLKALQASVNEDDKSGKGDCGLLVVAVGQQAGTFAHAMLGEGDGALEPAGYLLLGEEPLGPCSLSHGPHSPHGMLYRCTSPDSKKEVLLMWCAQKVSEERAFAWTQTLFAHVEPESVVVLSSLPSSSYTKGDLDESAHPPVLRMVETSLARKNRQTQQNKDEDNECAYLQPPNLCTGLPAAIMSHCEVHGLSAQLYLSVTDKFYPVASIEAFGSVLGNPSLTSLCASQVNAMGSGGDKAMRKRAKAMAERAWRSEMNKAAASVSRTHL